MFPDLRTGVFDLLLTTYEMVITTPSLVAAIVGGFVVWLAYGKLKLQGDIAHQQEDDRKEDRLLEKQRRARHLFNEFLPLMEKDQIDSILKSDRELMVRILALMPKGSSGQNDAASILSPNYYIFGMSITVKFDENDTMVLDGHTVAILKWQVFKELATLAGVVHVDAEDPWGMWEMIFPKPPSTFEVEVAEE